MSCAACSARVEKAVSSLDGIEECSVNLLTGTMITSGETSEEEIISAVIKAGYTASLKDGKMSKKTTEKETEKSEFIPIIKRFIVSLIFLFPLMYFSMGHNMFSFPVPSFFEGNHIALALLQLILSAIVIVINQKFL